VRKNPPRWQVIIEKEQTTQGESYNNKENRPEQSAKKAPPTVTCLRKKENKEINTEYDKKEIAEETNKNNGIVLDHYQSMNNATLSSSNENSDHPPLPILKPRAIESSAESNIFRVYSHNIHGSRDETKLEHIPCIMIKTIT
jgi:hypothetical protein